MNGFVGPVLVGSVEGRSVAAAIQHANPGCVLLDRGAYVRVRATSPCVVDVAALSEAFGRDVVLPQDLERLMTSFAGELVLGEREVRWR